MVLAPQLAQGPHFIAAAVAALPDLFLPAWIRIFDGRPDAGGTFASSGFAR
jgi:hypothetical protein